MKGQKTRDSLFNRRLKDIFYETRVLMGRGYTLNRFATEALGKMVDPVMLSYIEKGKRFATEPLVYKLAEVRGQDPRELLILLGLDRILHAFSKELRRVIKVEKTEKSADNQKNQANGISDAELAFVVSRAIAALPDDGGWITIKRWKSALEKALQETGSKTPPRLIQTVMDILQSQEIIECGKNRVKRLASHYVPDNAAEKRSLAMEFCAIFTKGMLDKIMRQDKKTYVRNHYLHIPEEKIEAFYARLDQNAQEIVKEYATEGVEGKFINVLISSASF